MTRDHDVAQLSTAELELTMHDLRANLSLISLDSPAHVPILGSDAGHRRRTVQTCR
jgi:hypothetical protein